MAKKRFGSEQAVTKLRQIDVLMGEGKNVQQAVREVSITDATYCR
jgi:putative transposase